MNKKEAVCCYCQLKAEATSTTRFEQIRREDLHMFRLSRHMRKNFIRASMIFGRHIFILRGRKCQQIFQIPTASFYKWFNVSYKVLWFDSYRQRPIHYILQYQRSTGSHLWLAGGTSNDYSERVSVRNVLSLFLLSWTPARTIRQSVICWVFSFINWHQKNQEKSCLFPNLIWKNF